MDGDLWTRLGYLGILLLIILAWAFTEYRKNLGQAVRTLTAWGLIFIALMVGYGLWEDIRKTSSLAQISSAEDRTVTLRRHNDGHFYATLRINNVPVDFIVDTGATNIVLSKRDAERIGQDLDSLRYLSQAQTANGMVRTAMISLKDVELGPYFHKNIRATVNDGDMQYSLLGMDYLRFFTIQIVGNQMILSQG